MRELIGLFHPVYGGLNANYTCQSENCIGEARLSANFSITPWPSFWRFRARAGTPTIRPLDLGGWALLDRLKQRMPLDPITLPAGETVRIQLQPPLQLGNQGGLLTLLNLTIVDQCRGSAGRTTSASMQCQGLTLLGST